VRKLETNPENRQKPDYRPVVGIAVISLLVCGLFFPLLVTAVGQAAFPYQANGSLLKLNGQDVGSQLIAENFALPIFFHPRNASASGVDPDITVQDAMSQIQGISNATGIPVGALQQLVNQNVDAAGRFVELQYVNVLELNIQLVQQYPLVYSAFT
jgi:potassium-transporting ATPase KdpC subunit